jgi:16S rRNA (guanine966-N2)-methyltransferase
LAYSYDFTSYTSIQKRSLSGWTIDTATGEIALRVISGTIRGRKLNTIGGTTVRPTADRVKEAMFNILSPRLRGIRALDLFAGSGALGIEAISRGARSAVFVDNNIQVLTALRHNLKSCQITDRTTVIQWDIKKNLECLNAFPQIFDLALMDPPYHRDLVATTIKHLLLSGCLARNATIVAEHEPNIQINLYDCPLHITKTRRYGSNQLSFFEFDSEHQD